MKKKEKENFKFVLPMREILTKSITECLRLINTYTNFVYFATDFTKTMLVKIQLASS